MGDWVNARNAFNQCIRINPDDAASYYGKAKVNFILCRTQDAVECLKSAFSIDPGIRAEFAKEYPEIKSSKLFKKLLGEL
jgi:tetratricopeptide (TPR) repeat protein